jgi:hypothetical protein
MINEYALSSDDSGRMWSGTFTLRAVPFPTLIVPDIDPIAATFYT